MVLSTVPPVLETLNLNRFEITKWRSELSVTRRDHDHGGFLSCLQTALRMASDGQNGPSGHIVRQRVVED